MDDVLEDLSDEEIALCIPELLRLNANRQFKLEKHRVTYLKNFVDRIRKYYTLHMQLYRSISKIINKELKYSVNISAYCNNCAVISLEGTRIKDNLMEYISFALTGISGIAMSNLTIIRGNVTNLKNNLKMKVVKEVEKYFIKDIAAIICEYYDY